MIADRIKLARRKAGFSLRELSDAMQNRVTAQAIGKYERGEDIPSSGVLTALSKAMGVSLAYLMDTQALQLAGVEFRSKSNTSDRKAGGGAKGGPAGLAVSDEGAQGSKPVKGSKK